MAKLYAFVDVPQSNHYWHRSPFTALERGTGCIRKIKTTDQGNETIVVEDCTEAMGAIVNELLEELYHPDVDRHPETHIDLCNLIKEGMHEEIKLEKGDARIPYKQINEIPDRVTSHWMDKYNRILGNMKGKPMNDKKESTAIARVDHKGIQITSFEDLWRFSKMVAHTEFVPAAFNGKPESICVAIQYGQELGFSPMQGLQSIAVINGKPSVYGDGLIALCMAHPDCESIFEYYDEPNTTAYCTVRRKGHKPHEVSFSKQDAIDAKLWGKSGPWTLYPKRMLQMRARGFALRDKFPDALRGVITVEEANDYPVPTNVVVSEPQDNGEWSSPTPDEKPAMVEAVNTHHPVISERQAEESHYETDPEFQSGVIDEQPEPEPTPPPQNNGNPAMHVLQFGKHKGQIMGDIPMDYVRWLAKQSGDKPANIAARAMVELDDDAHREHVQHDVGNDNLMQDSEAVQDDIF
jgi:hypothetical protein